MTSVHTHVKCLKTFFNRFNVIKRYFEFIEFRFHFDVPIFITVSLRPFFCRQKPRQSNGIFSLQFQASQRSELLQYPALQWHKIYALSVLSHHQKNEHASSWIVKPDSLDQYHFFIPFLLIYFYDSIKLLASLKYQKYKGM